MNNQSICEVPNATFITVVKEHEDTNRNLLLFGVIHLSTVFMLFIMVYRLYRGEPLDNPFLIEW